MVKSRPLDGACSSTAERRTVGIKAHVVGVAQLAEHMPVEHEVAGSFPVAHPKNKGIFSRSET